MKPSQAQLSKIKQSLLLQFPNLIFNFDGIEITISRKTNRIKSISQNNNLLFSLRTSDGRFLPTMAGGQLLLDLGYQRNRIYVNKDAEPFVASGKSAFCKHIIKISEGIYPESEVLILSETNELLAIGTAVQPGYAMLQLESGIAVKSKHHK